MDDINTSLQLEEIEFGRWKRKNIRWIVLDVNNGIATIITKKIITNQPFNSSGGDTSWETCSLRQWLNGDFYRRCFDEKEKERIALIRHDSIDITTEDVSDYVYLLSTDEVKKFLPDSINRGLGTWWWLRTTCEITSRACYIHDFGNIMITGYYVDNYIGVRPVMQIKI